MARLKFCGFDYSNRNGNPVNGSTSYISQTYDFALDSGMRFQSNTDDSTSYLPGDYFAGCYNVGRVGRNTSDGGAMGYYSTSGNINLASIGGYTQGVTCTRSTLGNPSELWVTMDVAYGALGNNVDNPATLQRSESRFQVFKWGDLSFRMRRVFNWAAGPTRADYSFELFNATTSLGVITVPSLLQDQWMHIRIHAKLDAAAGAFEVSVDGIASNHTGINTVAVTPLASATQLWFSAGALGSTSGSTVFSLGSIDNLLIDNAAFPAGRPSGRRVAISADNTVSGFAATSGGTLTAAVASIDSDYARGTGVGAYVRFDLAAVVTTGLNADILGFQLQACGVSNVDFINAKKLIGGIHLSGTNYDGTNWAGMTPPLTPSFVSSGTESIFYKGGTTNFTLTDIPNCKPRLEVANV